VADLFVQPLRSVQAVQNVQPLRSVPVVSAGSGSIVQVKLTLDNLQVLGFLGKRNRRRYLHCVFRSQETLESVDAQLYRGMVHLAGTKLNPSRFAPAERFESQQAKKIGP
jgi:hypothetical protein